MPCKYCKCEKFANSSTHTLSKCVASVESWVGPINELWLTHSCDVSYQRVVLLSYSNARLQKMCMIYHVPMKTSYTKLRLVTRLIDVMTFVRYIYPRALRLSVEEMSLIDAFYAETLVSEAANDGAWLDEMKWYNIQIELFYSMCFGRGDARRAEKKWLNPLITRVTLNVALQEVGECGICFEDRPRTRFGCLHDFCSDCVNTLCRSKCNADTRVSCPMCRANVSLYQTHSYSAYLDMTRLMRSLGVRMH
jgi:hypothetical protein